MTSLTEQLTDCETDLEEHELKMALLSDQLLLMREKLQVCLNVSVTITPVWLTTFTMCVYRHFLHS